MDDDKLTIVLAKPGGAQLPVDAGDLRLILEMGLNRCRDMIFRLQDQVCLHDPRAETWDEAHERIAHKLDEVYEMVEFADRMDLTLDWVKGQEVGGGIVQGTGTVRVTGGRWGLVTGEGEKGPGDEPQPRATP